MIAEKPTRIPRQKVLDALQEGIQTWDRLRALTKLNDERLGFAIGELLDLRKIWTGHHGSVRIYGIERRTDRVPRFTPPKRRATDIM